MSGKATKRGVGTRGRAARDATYTAGRQGVAVRSMIVLAQEVNGNRMERVRKAQSILFLLADVARANFPAEVRHEVVTAAFQILAGIETVTAPMRRAITRELAKC